MACFQTNAWGFYLFFTGWNGIGVQGKNLFITLGSGLFSLSSLGTVEHKSSE